MKKEQNKKRYITELYIFSNKGQIMSTVDKGFVYSVAVCCNSIVSICSFVFFGFGGSGSTNL